MNREILRPEDIEQKIYEENYDLLASIVDRNCVGCVLLTLGNVVKEFLEDEERGESILKFAKEHSGRTEYCGSCTSRLWGIPRNEAHALAEPWKEEDVTT